MSTDSTAPLFWYAITFPQGKILQAEAVLKQAKLFTYIPTVTEDYITKSGVKKRRERPIISNILFVQSTYDDMRTIKREYNTLIRFISRPDAGSWVPVIIPNKQMDDFMKVYSISNPNDIIILSPDEVGKLRENAKVRICDGIFEGVEGYYQRVKGANKKQFIVKIEGMVACATVMAECKYVEVMK